jgi:hypothetical protein
VRTIRNTQIHCVGRMQSFGVLKQVVHIVTVACEGCELLFLWVDRIQTGSSSEWCHGATRP